MMRRAWMMVGVLLSLTGCPPGAAHVCDKLAETKSADYTPPAKEPCLQKLDAMKSRSSGEYGMCSQCVMDARDQAGVAKCREACPGFEDALPAK